MKFCRTFAWLAGIDAMRPHAFITGTASAAKHVGVA